MFNARVSPIEVAKATGEQHEALLESVVAPCVSAGCVHALSSGAHTVGLPAAKKCTHEPATTPTAGRVWKSSMLRDELGQTVSSKLTKY